MKFDVGIFKNPFKKKLHLKGISILQMQISTDVSVTCKEQAFFKFFPRGQQFQQWAGNPEATFEN